MGRPPCCDKLNVKRGLWTAEEDAKILAYVATHGIGNWTLRPDLNHNNFTPQEEDLILRLHRAIGSRWSLIAKQLGGRTDNDVKNYWNTKLRKKLTKMEIDPVTHKPFSQIISDLGNIGAANTNPIITPPPRFSTPPQESNTGRGFVPPQESTHRWSDFISEGDFLSCEAQRDLHNENFGSNFANGNGGGDKAAAVATPSSSPLMSSSFVNEILDWDSQMQMEFTDVRMDGELFDC